MFHCSKRSINIVIKINKVLKISKAFEYLHHTFYLSTLKHNFFTLARERFLQGGRHVHFLQCLMGNLPEQVLPVLDFELSNRQMGICYLSFLYYVNELFPVLLKGLFLFKSREIEIKYINRILSAWYSS